LTCESVRGVAKQETRHGICKVGKDGFNGIKLLRHLGKSCRWQ
jgi:hypothetical protein